MKWAIPLFAATLFGCDPGDGDEGGGDSGTMTDTATGDDGGDTTTETGTDETGTDETGTDDTGTETGTDVCGADQELDQWPSSGFVIEFEVAEQRAHLWVDSQSGIEHVARWLDHTDESLGVPGGPIELDGTHNPGYSYRMVPTAVMFADAWIEVCDAAPCYIESYGPAEWMASPGTWCPWAFSAVQVWDCRQHESGGACPSVWP
jgi:hypothetical protein